MTTVTTGRTLDEADEPVPGTGFEFDADGELASLLAERTGPLNSHPTRPVWSAPLAAPEEETIRSVSVLGPGYDGLPEHYHERSIERFEVRAGRPVFHVDGEDRPAKPGETVTVDTGQRHSFSVPGDDLSYMVTDIHSPGRLRHVLPTLGGIAHDPEADAENPLRLAMVARRLAGNTVFTELDPRIGEPLTRALEPLARLGGYRGAYAKYRQPAFWRAHVEQPRL
ncbi:MAG: cupin domain-containing protein [Halolamina sp.]